LTNKLNKIESKKNEYFSVSQHYFELERFLENKSKTIYNVLIEYCKPIKTNYKLEEEMMEHNKKKEEEEEEEVIFQIVF
jgi:hypothetical protein